MKKVVYLLAVGATALFAACQSDENLVETSGLNPKQSGKLQFTAYSADADTRTHTAGNCDDKMVLWDETGEKIQLWASCDAGCTYNYIDAFVENDCYNNGTEALFVADTRTEADLRTGTWAAFGDASKNYCYRAVYDPTRLNAGCGSRDLTAYPFVLGEWSAADTAYVQDGAWKNTYDALYGECFGKTNACANTLLNVTPDMKFSHFFSSMEINLDSLSKPIVEAEYSTVCDEGISKEPNQNTCDCGANMEVACTKTVTEKTNYHWYEVLALDEITLTFPKAVVGKMNLNGELGMSACADSTKACRRIRIKNVADLSKVRTFFRQFELLPDEQINVQIRGRFLEKNRMDSIQYEYNGKRIERWTRAADGKWSRFSEGAAVYETTASNVPLPVTGTITSAEQTATLNLKIKTTEDSTRVFIRGKIYTINLTPSLMETCRDETHGYKIEVVDSRTNLAAESTSNGVLFDVSKYNGFRTTDPLVASRSMLFTNEAGSTFSVTLGSLFTDMAADPAAKCKVQFQFSTVNHGCTYYCYEQAPKMKAEVLRNGQVVASFYGGNTDFYTAPNYRGVVCTLQTPAGLPTFALRPTDVLRLTIVKPAVFWTGQCGDAASPEKILVKNITARYFYQKK